jgi:hypothetical protein
MNTLFNIRWFFIRILLTEKERLYIHEGGERYFDQLYERSIREKDKEYNQELATDVAQIMRGVRGSTDYTRWS